MFLISNRFICIAIFRICGIDNTQTSKNEFFSTHNVLQYHLDTVSLAKNIRDSLF